MKMVAEYHIWGCDDRILSKLIFSLVFSLILQLDQVESEEPKMCTLKIKRGAEKIENGRLCLEEYFTTSCKKFVNTFQRSDLPAVFEKERPSAEKPSNVKLEPLINKPFSNGKIYPGIEVTWEPPLSVAARGLVDGYLLIFQEESSNAIGCRLFKFNSSNPLINEKLLFQYDIQYVRENANYLVKVYSLPPPMPRFKDEEDSFGFMHMTTSVAYREVDPGNWAPSLTVKCWKNGTIQVKFTLSPPKLNLTDYTVMLLKESRSRSNYYLQKQLFNMPKYTPEEPEGSVIFKDLVTDKYQVVIWVEDKYHKQPGMCQCWIMEDEERSCKNICGSIKTKWMLIEFQNPQPHSDTSIMKMKIKPRSMKVLKAQQQGWIHQTPGLALPLHTLEPFVMPHEEM